MLYYNTHFHPPSAILAWSGKNPACDDVDNLHLHLPRMKGQHLRNSRFRSPLGGDTPPSFANGRDPHFADSKITLKKVNVVVKDPGNSFHTAPQYAHKRDNAEFTRIHEIDSPAHRAPIHHDRHYKILYCIQEPEYSDCCVQDTRPKE